MKEKFCISPGVLGSELSVEVSDEGFSTPKNISPDSWALTGGTKNEGLCLDSLLKIAHVEVPSSPPTKWTTAMAYLTTGSVMWSYALPASHYRSFVKNLVNSIAEVFEDLPKDYYRDVWAPAGQLLSALRPARVDPIIYRELAASSERDGGALETFRPGPGGFLPVVVYDRFATRTGRLTVGSGPNILTLKKDHRRLLKSNFPGGRIVSLDFGALEARIILSEAGHEVGCEDLYEKISSNLFSGSIDRSTVKTAVISELYGSSKAALGARLGVGKKKLDAFVDSVQAYFGTPALRRRLKEEYTRTGKIKNRFGRPLELDDPQDHLFVNTYAQSTGVDVSLLGFKSIVDSLGSDGIRPLFALHDALILDVRPDRLRDVAATTSVEVRTFSSPFPVKYEEVSSSCVQSSADELV